MIGTSVIKELNSTLLFHVTFPVTDSVKPNGKKKSDISNSADIGTSSFFCL